MPFIVTSNFVCLKQSVYCRAHDFETLMKFFNLNRMSIFVAYRVPTVSCSAVDVDDNQSVSY